MPEPIEYLSDPGVPYRQTEEAKEAARFYNEPRWRKVRAYYLSVISPLCERCKEQGRIKAATHVHHKVERTHCPDPYDIRNLQATCTSCHTTIHNQRRGKPQ